MLLWIPRDFLKRTSSPRSRWSFPVFNVMFSSLAVFLPHISRCTLDLTFSPPQHVAAPQNSHGDSPICRDFCDHNRYHEPSSCPLISASFLALLLQFCSVSASSLCSLLLATLCCQPSLVFRRVLDTRRETLTFLTFAESLIPPSTETNTRLTERNLNHVEPHQ